MGKKKKKIAKLTEEQYNAYISSLRESHSLGTYGTCAPPLPRKDENKKD